MTAKRLSVYVSFFLKAVLIASAIMLICMALGELCWDKNLFSGFLYRPILWAGIVLETTVATLFMTTLGALILYRFRFFDKKASLVFLQGSGAR